MPQARVAKRRGVGAVVLSGHCSQACPLRSARPWHRGPSHRGCPFAHGEVRVVLPVHGHDRFLTARTGPTLRRTVVSVISEAACPLSLCACTRAVCRGATRHLATSASRLSARLEQTAQANGHVVSRCCLSPRFRCPP